jgi:hypothetical protein
MVLDIGVPRFNQEGFFAGQVGSCVDITDRRGGTDETYPIKKAPFCNALCFIY